MNSPPEAGLSFLNLPVQRSNNQKSDLIGEIGHVEWLFSPFLREPKDEPNREEGLFTGLNLSHKIPSLGDLTHLYTEKHIHAGTASPDLECGSCPTIWRDAATDFTFPGVAKDGSDCDKGIRPTPLERKCKGVEEAEIQRESIGLSIERACPPDASKTRGTSVEFPANESKDVHPVGNAIFQPT